mmetsp:Transcript_24299/g.38259  ORF Transcript_24299/g.38259 Transcript_24299/m.38259 type:complete len:205 (-) Transcript_24299:156-770(-)
MTGGLLILMSLSMVSVMLTVPVTMVCVMMMVVVMMRVMVVVMMRIHGLISLTNGAVKWLLGREVLTVKYHMPGLFLDVDHFNHLAFNANQAVDTARASRKESGASANAVQETLVVALRYPRSHILNASVGVHIELNVVFRKEFHIPKGTNRIVPFQRRKVQSYLGRVLFVLSRSAPWLNSPLEMCSGTMEVNIFKLGQFVANIG